MLARSREHSSPYDISEVAVEFSRRLGLDARTFVPTELPPLEPQSGDLVVMWEVLEHLWEPFETLIEFPRLLAPGGVCLINVPSWRGKRFLELSAYRLGLSPPEEIDDHKTYYDPRDLWPLLVEAGFLPREIDCSTHKFGLNTFAACRSQQ